MEQTKGSLKLGTHVLLIQNDSSAVVLSYRCLTSACYECFSAGTCYFDMRDWYCRPRQEQFAVLLTEHSKNTTDGLCTYLRVDGFSQCYTHFTPRYAYPSERKCGKHKLCRWTSFECIPKEEFYLQAAADEDPRLKRRYHKFKKSCASYTTNETCAESGKLWQIITYAT